MIIYKSNYRNHWISPYTILEKVFFWREIDYNEPIIEKWSNRLNPICVAWHDFLDFVHPRISYVKIARYDTWSMDSTLADIILPMLKQLKETKHGSPFVEMEDVPEHLRGTTTEDWDAQLTFDFYEEDKVKEGINDVHARWDWVMNEMIFAFEKKANDTDWSATWEESQRMENGFRLFGTYYQGLWD
jgi:hypothetical protein